MRKEDYWYGAFSLVKNSATKFAPTPALYPSSKNTDRMLTYCIKPKPGSYPALQIQKIETWMLAHAQKKESGPDGAQRAGHVGPADAGRPGHVPGVLRHHGHHAAHPGILCGTRSKGKKLFSLKKNKRVVWIFKNCISEDEKGYRQRNNIVYIPSLFCDTDYRGGNPQ